MEWLYLLLTVLKFIGIALLFLFIILFFLFLVLLFGGIRYYVFVEKKERVCVRVRVSFIRIIKFVFFIDENINKRYIKILFFKFFKGGNFKEKQDKIEYAGKIENEFSEIVFDEKKDNKYEEIKEFSDGENFAYEKDIKKSELKKEKKFYSGKKQNNIFFTVKNIYNRFLYLKNYPEKEKIIQYTFNFIKELFLSVKPKKFKADLLVGFDDPSSTGKFIGFMAIISELLPFSVCFFGDFENEVFQGNVEMKGKTNILKICIPTLKYIFKAPVWRLIKNRKG